MASLLFVWRRAAGSVMFWWAPAALVRFGENPCHIQLPHQLLSPCSLLIPSNKTSNKLTLENSCLNESKLHRSSNDTQHSEIILHCIWTQVSSPKEYMRFKRQLSNGGAAWTEEYGDGIGRCSTAQGFYQNWKPNESCCLELMKVVTLTEQKDSPSVVKHEKRNPGTKKMLTRSWVGKMKNWRPSSMSWSTCHLNIWNHLEYLDNVEVTVFVGVFSLRGLHFPLVCKERCSGITVSCMMSSGSLVWTNDSIISLEAFLKIQSGEKGGMNVTGNRGFATAWATWIESLCDAPQIWTWRQESKMI